MKKNNNIISSANSAIRNNNGFSNAEMYNKSRTGWSEGTPAFRTPDLEYFDGKMTFAKAPNGYIASILSWYDNTATYYEKIDGRWFQLSKERTEEIQSELREKGRKMVEAAKQEMETKSIEAELEASFGKLDETDYDDIISEINVNKAMEYIQNLITINEHTDDDRLSETHCVSIYASREDDGCILVKVYPDPEFVYGYPSFVDDVREWDTNNDGLWMKDAQEVNLSELEEWLTDAVSRCKANLDEIAAAGINELQCSIENEGHNALDLLFSAFGNYASGEADWGDVAYSVDEAIEWLRAIASDAEELADFIN